MRKNYSKNLILLLLAGIFFSVCGANWLGAQVNMIRTSFTGAYTPIDTLSGATKSTAIGDDVFQDLLPIGFTFNYLGTNYTTFGVNTNGAGAFSGISGSAANTNLFTTAAPNTSVTAWWDDMRINQGTGIILYQTQGAPGSQTFTVQWTNVNSFYTGSTQLLNFQVKLYEGTNVIELKYGTVVPGTISTSESASLGIENAIGGPGNYIDAITGSKFVGHGFMTSTTKWPTTHFRYTPGATSPIAPGSYNVGVGQTYPTINEAVADLNHRGVVGPVLFNLTDALYDVTPAGGDNIFPVVVGPVSGTSLVNNVQFVKAAGYAVLRYEGETGGGIANQSTTTSMSTTTEPIIGLSGASFIGFQRLDLQCSPTGVVDRGISVTNNSAILGSQNNAFNDIKITLNRTNTSSIGIDQRLPSTPTAATGANSNNLFGDLQISNCYAGIYLLGNATYPDMDCQITTSSPTLFNTIGAATADDIGFGTVLSYGIRAGNQSGVKINNNIVRNVTSTSTVDGILVELGQGTISVYGNSISSLRNSSTTTTSGVSGIRANLATTGTHNLRVYNNFISGLTSSYAGTSSTTRQLRGIYVQAAGGGVNTLNTFVDNNSVSMDGSASPTISNTCFEIGTASGPVFTVRNNIFANFTAAQTGTATHSCWHSTSATAIGNTGSVSNYNDLYIANATNGNTGTGNTTAYATLANWQTAMVSDANSIAAGPSFNNNLNDLHASGTPLNGAATPIAWVTVDYDNQARNASTPDIGADEFTPANVDMAGIALLSPVAAGCYSAAQPITMQIRNNGLTPIDFSSDSSIVSIAVTGAITANLQYTINNNSLNGGTPLAVGANLTVPVGTINMTAAGTYTFNGSIVTTNDFNPANNGIPQVVINYQPGTASISRTSLCQGDSTRLSLAGNSSTSIQWEVSTNGGSTWNAIPGGTVNPYFYTPTATSVFRSVMCGNMNSTMTSAVTVTPFSNPTTTPDTVCGLDTLHLMASGSGTLNWYSAAVGGAPINSGPTYNVLTPTTTTYYVSNVSGGGTITVGPTTNAIGAGAQQASTAYNIFDVTQACVLQGAYAYPGAAGNVIVDLRDNAGVLITQVIYPVTAGDVGNRTWIPMNINLTPGTNFRLAQGTGSVSMWRTSAGPVYPYTSAAVNITGSSAGAAFYYFFYEWNLLTGCESSRVPVTGVVNQPAAMSAVASSPIICTGDSLTLTASSGNSGYVYTWSPSQGLSSTAGAVVTANPTSSISYIVEAIDGQNCVARDTVEIVVNAHPTGDFVASDSLICLGDSVMMGIAPFNGTFSQTTPVAIPDGVPAGAYSDIVVSGYSGTLGANSITRVCMDITHTWDSDLSMTLISPQGTMFDLSSANGGSGDNYTGTCFEMGAATNITAGTAPFTGTYVPEGAGGFAVFNGENPNGTWRIWSVDAFTPDPGTLNNWSIEFANRPKVYSWTSTPAGFTASTGQVTATPTVSTTYFLNLADSATGCDTTYMYMVNVNPPLVAAITGAPATNVCIGQTVTLGSSVSGGNNSYLYDWNGASTSNSYSFVATSDTMIILNVMDTCSTPMVSDTIMVIVNPALSATIGGAPAAPVCAGATVNLTSTVAGGDGSYTYDWNGMGTSSSYAVVVTGNTTIILNVLDGCSSPVASDTVMIMVAAPLTVNVTGGGSICAGQSITLNATTGGGTGSPVYAWSNAATTASITVSPAATTTYTVSVTDACGAAAVTGSQTVTVNPSAVAGFTSALTGNLTYAFTNTSTNGTTYMWTFGDGNTSTAASPTHTYATGGSFQVCLTATNSCGSDSSCSTNVVVGNDVAFGLSNVQVWPNPNNGNFNVRVNGLTGNDLRLELYNVTGQKVYEKQFSNPYDAVEATIETNVTKGAYFLRVTEGSTTATIRVMLQ